jgi:hypothetical protein
MVHARTHNRTHNTHQESVFVVSIVRFWPALPAPDTTPDAQNIAWIQHFVVCGFSGRAALGSEAALLILDRNGLRSPEPKVGESSTPRPACDHTHDQKVRAVARQTPQGSHSPGRSRY